MRKTINKVVVKGRIYDKSDLSIKTVQNKESKKFGQTFIGGKLDIATDDAGLNIVTVNFTFVQPTYNSGKTNTSYGILQQIIESGRTILTDGAESATLVKIDGSVALNDFYTDRSGQETLVSAKQVSGSFVNLISLKELGEDNNKRCTFETDMFINGTSIIEADPEKHIDEPYMKLKGAVFSFRNELLPVEFTVHSQGGIKYFESLDASPAEPVFTKVWGNIIDCVTTERIEEESAFGEPSVREVKRSHREYIITGTSSVDKQYEIGDSQNGITLEELQKAKQDREIYLAEVKRKSDEYKAKRNAATASSVSAASAQTAPIQTGDFMF